MKKKLLPLFIIFLYFGRSLLNIASASETTYQGHAEKIDTKKESSEFFTGTTDKLDRNDILKMTVSQVIEVGSSKEGDEFFAELTDDVEGRGGIIIPSGTIAHGRIKQVRGAKRLGIDGAIDLDFDYLMTPDGREIPIKGKMSTRLHPALAATKILTTDLGYTATGSVVGGVMALAWLGLGGAVASQGCSVAGGAALGGTTGLGMSLYRKGKDVLISPGDEIRVKITTSTSLPVYKKTALIQREIAQEGLDIKIDDITYEKDAFGEASTITLSLSVLNMTDITFSTFDLALVNSAGTAFYPAAFADDDPIFKEIKPKDNIKCKIPFSVDNVKQKFWLTFYDRKNEKIAAEISITNAYRKISNKKKKQNERIFKKNLNFHKDY